MQKTSIAGIKFRWFLFILLFPSICTGQVVRSYQQVSDGINVILPEGTLKLCPLNDYAIRIRFYKDPIVKVPELHFYRKFPCAGISGYRSTFQVGDKSEKHDCIIGQAIRNIII